MSNPNERKEKAHTYQGGLAVGSFSAVAVATLVATIVRAMPDDPLKPVLNLGASVSADRLAADIAKDPKLQERWKAMREFVESLDHQIGKNLEQAAGASKDNALQWRERLEDSKRDSHGHIPPG